MGYGFAIYAVNTAKLVAACGSGDDEIRRGVHEIEGDRLAQLDGNFDLSYKDGGPSFFAAVDQLIMGGDKPFEGHLYAYAYEAIIDFFGSFLDNSLFYPFSSQSIDEIDRQLAIIGVPIRLKQLISGAAVVEFPRPDDFPAFGLWPPEQVAKSLPLLRAKQAKSEELNAMEQWLERAAAQREAIAGFYY